LSKHRQNQADPSYIPHSALRIPPSFCGIIAGEYHGRKLADEESATVTNTLEAPTARPAAEALAGRVAQLRRRLGELDVDTFLVSNAYNRRYLSGFTGEDDPPSDNASSGMLLITQDRALLVTDSRYDIQAERETHGVEIVLRKGRMKDALIEYITGLNTRRLGFEANHLVYALHEDLVAGLPNVTLVPTRRVIAEQRLVKDEAELALMRRAAAISDEAITQVAPQIRAGMTEIEVARLIESTMVALGAEAPAFATIVAAGPNGAMAHAVPGDRPIQEGEPIVIDMGARYHGYNSDMTRTIILGTPDARFREIYNIVLEAKQAAEAAIREGFSGQEADKLARDVITAAGYGDQFGHSLGHGIGLEVHEGPKLSKISEDTLPANAVTSCEPGIYLPDWGGVRLEDLILVRPDGVEILTGAPLHGPY
jgi:Xaa-Pro aminopeptidase